MPIVNIESVKQFNPTVRKEILRAIHAVTAEALQIPPTACHVRWIEIKQENYFCKTDKPENHIYIEIKLFAGRSLEVKKRLYQSIFNVFRNHNLEIEGMMIALHEISMENWGMCGGIAGSELSFDYKVNL